MSRRKLFVPGQDQQEEYTISSDECIEQIMRLAQKEELIMGQEETSFITDIICRKRNAFLTGAAGTGKSTAVKMLKQLLHYYRIPFAVTAPTGVAASLLAGRTIHSWLGIGLGPAYDRDKDARDYTATGLNILFSETIQNKLNALHRFSPGKLKTLRNTEVLIIDEVSMLSGKSLLDFIDAYLRRVRDDDRPFGGMIVVFVGDFLQLPPVSRSSMYEGESDWAFLCNSWRSADLAVYQLTKVHRQKDVLFARCLETIRKGEVLDAQQMNLLRTCYRDNMSEEDILKTTYIMPKNKMCDDHNMWAVSKLQGDLTSIPCTYFIREKHMYRGDSTSVERQLRSATKHKECLYLKPGCEVLMTVNDLDQGFFNGTRARILDMIKGPDGAYDRIVVYTNLSISYEEALKIRAGKQDLQVESHGAGEPTLMDTLGVCIVSRKATTRGNYEPAEDLVDPETPDEKAEFGDEQIPEWPRMLQFPVIPAYAVTVHSSQGVSLATATINTDESFAYGQVYVALSRVRSAEGLTLVHHDICNPVDPEAKAFHLEVENQSIGRPPCPT